MDKNDALKFFRQLKLMVSYQTSGTNVLRFYIPPPLLPNDSPPLNSEHFDRKFAGEVQDALIALGVSRDDIIFDSQACKVPLGQAPKNIYHYVISGDQAKTLAQLFSQEHIEFFGSDRIKDGIGR